MYCVPRCTVSYSSISIYYLLYCLGRPKCWSCYLLTCDHLIMAMIGPHFAASSTVLLDTTGFHLGVALSSSTWTTKTSVAGIYGQAYQHHQQQLRHVLYQDHCQHNILPSPSPLSAFTSPLSNVRTSVLLKGPTGLGQHVLLLQASDIVLLLMMMMT